MPAQLEVCGGNPVAFKLVWIEKFRDKHQKLYRVNEMTQENTLKDPRIVHDNMWAFEPSEELSNVQVGSKLQVGTAHSSLWFLGCSQ